MVCDYFSVSNWDTVERRATVEISDAIAALPNVQGFSQLGSQHQAMLIDLKNQKFEITESRRRKRVGAQAQPAFQRAAFAFGFVFSSR